MFHCYTQCSCSFDIYELIKKRYELLGISYDFFKDIVLKVGDKSALSFEDSLVDSYQSECEKYDIKQTEVNLKEIDSNILNSFTKFYTPEWQSDGIGIEAMKTFNILYSIPQNKIIIPHYDVSNRLIGIRGRALNEEDLKFGKYMPIQIMDELYNHPLGYNLYGLNLNKENIRKKKMAIIFESEKAVLQSIGYLGLKNNIAVGMCGSTLSNYQFHLLLDAGAKEICIGVDRDFNNLYDEEYVKVLKKMEKMYQKYSPSCNISFMLDVKGLTGYKHSPTDDGREIFLNLWENRLIPNG
jgi:hypothetical protein